ncbi:MAG TPA: restriction endonuclease subunit S [Candidatus Nanopelagicaceae bacterium]|nr:restriction endonuclease subunit S [Candidatus Nanopelagicaceae bacterium]
MKSDWAIRTIESLCTRVTSGGTPSRKVPAYFESQTDSIPWVKTAELNDGTIWETEEHISQQAIADSSAKLLPPNTLLLAMYGATVGQLGILGRSMTCNQASCALIVDPDAADFRFLFYRLLHDRASLISLAVGGAQQNLSGNTIKKFSFLCPPLEEQRRIAGVLSGLDGLIEMNRVLAAQAEDLARALVGRSPNTCSLSDLAKTEKMTEMPSGQVEHFSLPAFDSGALPERVLGSEIRSAKTLLTRPTALVSRLNPKNPRVWMAYPGADQKAFASTEFVALVGESVCTEVVWAVCSSFSFSDTIQTLVSGTTGSHQRVDKAAVLQVSVPDARTLSPATTATVSSLVHQAHSLRRENQQLSTVRNELLPLLMSGTISVGKVAA